VLAAWAASPTRFREDANAEDDLALGGYRDRVVVELAQNAADAARRAGVPGRLLLRLSSGTLTAANTGAPLDPAGVAALSTLRASAKRDGESVGRFGVGFAAVLAVSDEPAVHSRSGAVRWSRTDAAAAVAGLPDVTAELARRGGRLPVLRLPWPAVGKPPAGYDTAVVLPLRDIEAEALVRRLLDAVDPTLLLVLPGLAALDIEVDGRRRRLAVAHDDTDLLVDEDGERTRWRVVTRTGALAAALLADRPVEERDRPVWSVTWALPVDHSGAPVPLPGTVPAVVHAPTPTDEPLSLPAVLAASLPLDPSRRHVAPGALRDFLLVQAAQAYADLLAELPAAPAVLELVPGGLAAGEVDAVLRRAILDRLVRTPFLPAAEDPVLRLRPADALALDLGAPVVEALAPVLAGLLPADWAARLGPLAVLGVRRLEPAGLVELLQNLSREPAWWGALYDAIGRSHLGGPERDSLGALPVPLADGGSARGPRGVLLPGPDVPATVLTALGLRVAHPEAARPLLGLLGAVETTARSVLEHPRVQAAVAASYDAEDPAPVADAVLELVRSARIAAGEMPGLADLALPGDDGEWYPAGELLLPGGPLAGVVADDAPFGRVAPALADRWGPDVLTAVGVLATFALLREADAALEPAYDLDSENEWVAVTRGALPPHDLPPALAELTAVRDLELVRPDRWPAALELLAGPPLRAAATEPALVLLADGHRVAVRPYTAWWLSSHPVLGGRRPAELALPGADPLLAGLYDEAPAGHDPAWLRAIGVVTELADAAPADVLDRLADPDRGLSRAAVREIHARLAESGFQGQPAAVRAVLGGRLTVVPARDAAVVDAPDLRPLLGRLATVPAPLSAARAVADLLDVALASELSAYAVRSAGRERQVPGIAGELMAGLPASYLEYDELVVEDADGRPVSTAWRVVGQVVHARPDGLGPALAWAAGRWADRWALSALLRDPAALPRLLDDADLDG